VIKLVSINMLSMSITLTTRAQEDRDRQASSPDGHLMHQRRFFCRVFNHGLR